MVKIKTKLLSLKEIQELEDIHTIVEPTLESPAVIVAKHKGKKVMIMREGKCESQKCGSACCKFVHLQNSNPYYDNFGEKGKFGTKLNLNCKNLCSSSGNCNVFKTKKLPKACSQFPNINDLMYWEVFDVCSYRFRAIYELRSL